MFHGFAVIALIATPLLLIGHFGLQRARGRGGACIAGAGRWSAGLVLLGVGACGVASLVPVLSGREVRGWWLLAHVGASPVLIVGLLGLALRRAARATAAKTGACGERAVGGRGGQSGGCWNGWCTLTLGVLTAGSSLLSMGTGFGQETMAVLLQVHRYCGVLLCVAAMIHGYCSFVVGDRALGRPGGE